MELVVRDCVPDDAAAIQTLNREEMGYDYPLSEVKKKLAYLLSGDKDRLFVAELAGEVVGYIHACTYEQTYVVSLKDIMGIAVSHHHQRQGIGKALLRRAEAWAKESGASGIRLVSGETRTNAHAFYRHMGYTSNKKQLNFKKQWEE